jgi:hypothetical protein
MDRTSWKPKIYKATETVDHKESLQDVHDSPSIVNAGKDIMKRQIQAYNDNPTPEGDSYGEPQGYPWQYGEESNFVYDYEASWKNATLKQERLHLLLEADKTIDNNLISELIEKNWGDLPYEWQQKIKNAGVIPMYESKANEGLIDNIWGLLIDSSRMQFLDEYMGDMNTPLMITMGVMSMPQTNEEVADALGVSKSEALKFISQWAYDNGITDTVYTEAKANEDDHKKSWSELDSIAKMGFSDIGYDQQSWDSEPEEVRAEMETVVKDNMSQENWKEVANKIYKEELNKGKKSGGEGLIPYQELLNHTRVDKEGDFVLCNYCNQTYDLGEMDELIDNNTITKHLHGHGIRSPVVTAYDVLKDTESKANEDVGDSWYTRIVKCDQCDGQGSLDDYDRPAWSAGMRGTTKCSSCDGTGEKEETQNITDPYGDLHYMNESKVERYKVGDDYYDDLDDAKLMSDVTGYPVFDNDSWGKIVYDGESKASEDYEEDKKIIDKLLKKNGSVSFDDFLAQHGDYPQSLRKSKRYKEGGEADPCWKGYKQIGMKDKNGKQVPNCVPNANESYLVEWGYDLDYDFAEIDNLEDAKQKAIDKGGNVYLDNTLVYSVIPSKKIDPENDKSSFITANHLMDVESWGNWTEDPPKMSQHDEIMMMKDLGIADKTLKDMGYNLQKDGIEGLIDKIEKELSKFGIDLDKPEEQEE